MNLRPLDVIMAGILGIGGLNWGLIGFFGFDLVAHIFGDATVFTRVAYSLVGISALYELLQWKAIQRRWNCHV
jgi:hypothetical protein